MTEDEPSAIVERHRDRLLALAGVSGVAYGLSPTRPGERCILVYGRSGTTLPSHLDGLAVELVPTGEFRAE